MTLDTLAAKRGQLGQLAQGGAPSGVPSGWVTATDIPLAEANALEELYNLTDGANWTSEQASPTWGQTATANDWFGVTVSGGGVSILNLNTNALNGNVSTWQLGDFTAATQMRLHANGNETGDISGWNVTSVLQRLWILQTTLFGSPDLSSAVALNSFRYEDCALSQADVDAVLQEVYDNRFDFTFATPALNIGGTNSAPSAAGLTLIALLTAGVGFNPWIITYTAP